MDYVSHLDKKGRPRMVDVSHKEATSREAIAEGRVLLPDTIRDVLAGGGTGKGDVFKVAEVAGIMAVKKTSELVPLCHNIRIESVNVSCELLYKESAVAINCKVSTREVTGVEMEALTGVMIAALTVYDMCKGIDKGMVIQNVRLLHKVGGKSGEYRVSEGEIL